jgi:DNA-binding CsgD family transcriptional regulator
MSDTATVAPLGSPITPRELAALRAWRRHGSIPRAALSLGRSEHTVREQLRNVRSRLGVTRTADAAHIALD